MYRAEVEGNELYDVEVHLGSRGEVVYTECDCPYDMGAIGTLERIVSYLNQFDLLELYKTFEEGVPKVLL
ncbi:hypothetical protein ASG93_27265 [Paenibacillus sp. Soil787]|nr:hypothetical protein ASG93_27265 [Paenibacillus sp. Soil787]